MKPFRVTAEIESSKSLFNRALITSSFFPELEIQGFSKSDDVKAMAQAVKTWRTRSPIDCHEAGTVIRFLAYRVAREPGEFILTGTPRLLSRPMDDLKQSLAALGVHLQIQPRDIRILGRGWQKPTDSILISRQKSSQFASGILLSAWNLDFDLRFHWDTSKGHVSEIPLSESYFQMTVACLRELGMQIDEELPGHWLVPRGQRVRVKSYRVEPDASSMFAVAAAAMVERGEVHFKNVGPSRLQPDFAFLELLKKWGASWQQQGSDLSLKSPGHWLPFAVNLAQMPDLFPVMAVLAAFAEHGVSRLTGAPHLRLKESDRIAQTKKLLELAGIECRDLPDGLEIHGQGMAFQPRTFAYSPDADHRMAMAAGLFQLREPQIQILDPLVVNKSFPDFWALLREARA